MHKEDQALKPLRFALVLLFAVYFSLFFLNRHDLTGGFDHAKLVKYGQVIWEEGRVFNTNHFSYTAPDYPFINHHWLTGLIFYPLHLVAGFTGLSILALLINLAAMLMMLYWSARSGNFWITLLVMLFVIPMLASRHQPRPEMFSILFFVANLTLLHAWYIGILNRKYLWVLPALQLLWVNIHILFYFGIFLQATIFLQLLVNPEKREEWKYFGFVMLASIIACFMNPAFAQGVFYPFRIMGEIEYAVSENLSLIFHRESSGQSTGFYYFELALFVGALILYYWIKNPRELRTHFDPALWLLAFAALFIWRIRANVFFAYTLVLAATYLASKIKVREEKFARRAGIIGMAALIFFAYIIPNTPYDPWYGGYLKPGLGVNEKMDGGARYFTRHQLQGPIFNNFDIGDYLIYHLYPEERVFVDSRPEAYPPGFFTDKLVPVLFDQGKWLALDHAYKFNVIFLGYHTQVLNFVQRLYYDDGWFLAYSDDYTIIFLRRGPKNDHLVRQALLDRKALNEIVEIFRRNEEMERRRFWE
jgi:hypothetical protein